jgi:hypothetical protein
MKIDYDDERFEYLYPTSSQANENQAYCDYECSNEQGVTDKFRQWNELELPNHVCDPDDKDELCDSCHQILVDFLLELKGRRNRTKLLVALIDNGIRSSIFDGVHSETKGGLDTMTEIFDEWAEKKFKQAVREKVQFERECEQDYERNYR